jgi:Winged helix DNA-binding domain
VHAARLPSPYATILARAAHPGTALSVLAAHDGLTTLRCMRKTLHLLPLDLAAVAHAATSHYRTRDAARLAHHAGLPASAVTHLTRQLLALLADGPMPHRQIEATLATARHPVTVVRVALKIAWERGDVTYLNQSGCWNQEHRAFGLTSALRPGLNIAMDRTQATRALVETYFDRYGPATIKDAMWWSALSRGAITSGMCASDAAWVEIRTPWAAAPAYMPATRYEDFLQADSSTSASGVNLLAHEDVALKAYFETRDRYLDGLPPRTAFNQIGEALPTIVIDGIVHGTWAWNPATRAATTLLATGRARGQSRRVRTASDILTDALRAGWRARDTSERNIHAGQLALIV